MAEFIGICELFEIFAIEVETREIEVAGRNPRLFDLRDELFIYIFEFPIRIVDEWGQREHLITGNIIQGNLVFEDVVLF